MCVMAIFRQRSVDDLTHPRRLFTFEQSRPDLHLHYPSNLRRPDGNK
jgi:hypothetical protein